MYNRKLSATSHHDLEPLPPPRRLASTPPASFNSSHNKHAQVDVFATPHKAFPSRLPRPRAPTSIAAYTRQHFEFSNHTDKAKSTNDARRKERVRIARSRLREISVHLQNQSPQPKLPDAVLQESTFDDKASVPLIPPDRPTSALQDEKTSVPTPGAESISISPSLSLERLDDLSLSEQPLDLSDNEEIVDSGTDLTSILLDEHQTTLSSLDLSEYALVEALNASPTAGMAQMDTLDLLSKAHCTDQSAAHTAAAQPKPFETPLILEKPMASHMSTSPPSSPPLKTPAAPAPTHNLSPLEYMDPLHLQHLAKVYGISLQLVDLKICSSIISHLHDSAPASRGFFAGASTGIFSQQFRALVCMQFPDNVGSRQFDVLIRNSALYREQRGKTNLLRRPGARTNSSRRGDASHDAVSLPTIRIPCGEQEVLPLRFTGELVNVFLTQNCTLLFKLQRNCSSLAGEGALNLTRRSEQQQVSPSLLTAQTQIALLNLLRSPDLVYQEEVPLFAADSQFIGYAHIMMSLLPPFVDYPPSPPHKPCWEPTRALPVEAEPVYPEPPFSLSIYVEFGAFIPPVPLRSSYKTTLADEHAHNITINVQKSLSLCVRHHVPLETASVPWTLQQVNQLVGKVMDQVSVNVRANAIHFDAQMEIPTSVNLLAPWMDTPLIVELWAHTDHCRDECDSNDAKSPGMGATRALYGIAKLPLHHILNTMLKSVPRVSWKQLLPIGLKDIDFQVVDPLTAETRGWLTASILVGQRNQPFASQQNETQPAQDCQKAPNKQVDVYVDKASSPLKEMASSHKEILDVEASLRHDQDNKDDCQQLLNGSNSTSQRTIHLPNDAGTGTASLGLRSSPTVLSGPREISSVVHDDESSALTLSDLEGPNSTECSLSSSCVSQKSSNSLSSSSVSQKSSNSLSSSSVLRKSSSSLPSPYPSKNSPNPLSSSTPSKNSSNPLSSSSASPKRPSSTSPVGTNPQHSFLSQKCGSERQVGTNVQQDNSEDSLQASVSIQGTATHLIGIPGESDVDSPLEAFPRACSPNLVSDLSNDASSSKDHMSGEQILLSEYDTSTSSDRTSPTSSSAGNLRMAGTPRCTPLQKATIHSPHDRRKTDYECATPESASSSFRRRQKDPFEQARIAIRAKQQIEALSESTFNVQTSPTEYVSARALRAKAAAIEREIEHVIRHFDFPSV